MNIFDNTLTFIKQPAVLKSYKHILLLSHMRANTSLFGHVLGDHEEINGYYEMHIGYYSWKSLLRQKLLFANSHNVKKNSTYFFDKILHSEHYVNESVINRRDVLPIFSLRPPTTTIPSIVKLYQVVDPSHVFATKQGALNYYIERINTLKALASRTQDYIYIDADAIRAKTDECLTNLTVLFGLQEGLTPAFKQQKLTGVGNTGDHSGNLLTGEVKQQTNNYEDFDFTEQELESVVQAYNNARVDIKTAASNQVICDE